METYEHKTRDMLRWEERERDENEATCSSVTKLVSDFFLVCYKQGTDNSGTRLGT